ncbi:uroporphyrinogen-III C-methyltransferase [Nitrospina gracilis]|uniref:uroporphyrinogen-III C-methyltransferase n=1 Tax=Nitrospina gracilis TaxID=35801 RepID=UPI001F010094|nr:uroporphyrinogen-III C-methyltransferase [Nitrospina gracilis]MCF8719612.1 uroporphyrinogen III methyltransferase/synthase [Nitrospina gracilis Nb-211]
MSAAGKQGKVILVGAGPGDIGLFTLKGKAWLERADVVIYDYLANARLLAFAPKHAEVIYAGKKEGHVTFAQEEMNAMLIEKAKAGKIVVRLKGGDPFIFGRGGEECVALQKAGVPFEVVPGVTASTGVSAYAGIPLTHRDFSSTISIVTGSNEKGKEDLHIDWEKIASRAGTLVFLMGARKLQRISENLMKYGKDPKTPIAVIQWGTTPRQKTWTGTLDTIVDIAQKEEIKPPALTIVGEVVNLKPHMDWFETLPLFGKTVVITRAEEQADDFSQALLERGAEPYLFPVIETVEPESWEPLDRALGELENYDGLIFTSTNGVRCFMQRLKETGRDIRDLKGLRLFAIGPKTEQAVTDLGIPVEAVPEKFVAESLIETLGKAGLKGKRLLLPRAAVARETLPDTLRQMGIEVDVCPAYRTVLPDTDAADLIARLQEGSIHVLTFTASSTVNHFMQLVGDKVREHLDHVTVACIGPITAKTATDLGLPVHLTADTYTVSGLIQAMEDYFQQRK